MIIWRAGFDGSHSGASSTPGLRESIAERIQPWRQFAEDALTGALQDHPPAALVPSKSRAHAVVALYLGLELLADLGGDRAASDDLFAHARSVATLFASFQGTETLP